MKGIRIMRELIKDNLKFLIFLAIFGLVGGYFTALYSVQILTQEMLDEVIAQVGSVDVLIVITTLQSLSYAIILGKIELIFVTLVGGAAFILLDVLIFGNFSEAIKDSYAIKPTFEYIIASVTYGAVIEEIILRLFFMSLIAFIIQKIAKKEEMNDRILMIANGIAALLFAAGHLPATIMSISPITPMIIFRCFLLNGGFGLMFGRLYRKYGIHYAMLAHGGVHIVSKLIWILFI